MNASASQRLMQESKESMRNRGEKSPSYADTFMQPFAVEPPRKNLHSAQKYELVSYQDDRELLKNFFSRDDV